MFEDGERELGMVVFCGNDVRGRGGGGTHLTSFWVMVRVPLIRSLSLSLSKIRVPFSFAGEGQTNDQNFVSRTAARLRSVCSTKVSIYETLIPSIFSCNPVNYCSQISARV